MNERAIDAHSVNCWNCHVLADERETMHIYANGEEVEICEACFENEGFTHCDVCDRTKPDSEMDAYHSLREELEFENICKECRKVKL